MPFDAPTAAAQEYLLRQGLDFDKLLDLIGDTGSDAIMVLHGSVPMGVANDLSDIDVMVLGTEWRGPPGSIAFVDKYADVLYRTENGKELNVQIWSEDVLGALSEKMAQCYRIMLDPSDISAMPSLEDWEYALLHDLHVGVPLKGGQRLQQYRDQLRTHELHLHTIMRCLVYHYADREDMIGQLAEGKIDNAKWMLRLTMVDLTRAMMASFGQTDYRARWLLNHLKDCQAHLGDETLKRYRQYICEWPDDRALDEIIEDAISFSDSQIYEIVGRAPSLLPLLLKIGEKASVAQKT